jgi:LysR family pca operon transcriptional activator
MPASLSRLKLHHLRCLIAIAEQGSLVRAADALAITQSAVSKTIAELENIVARRLLVRTNKGVTLTTSGRILLRYAGSSLRTLREGLDSIAESPGEDAPVVVIGALPNVAATVLPRALQRFAAEVPQSRVRVCTGSNGQLVALLRQGELDLLVGRLAEPSDMQGLSFEHLYTEKLIFAVRAGHPLAGRSQIAPAELVHYRLVLPDAGTRIRESADQFFMATGIGVPKEQIETIDVSFGRSYVLLTDAVWCAPVWVVENDVQNGMLVRLPLNTDVTAGPVGLTLRADRLPSEAMQRVLAEIRIAAAEWQDARSD